MSTCIPYAAGIFHTEGPPNWGFAGLTTRVFDTVDPAHPFEGAIKDPRWVGSVTQSFGIGTAEDASFRALFSEDGSGKRYLYFSWHVKFDSDPGSVLDRIFVAIQPDTGGGLPLVMEIEPFNDSLDHLTATAPQILAGRRRTSVGPMSEPIGSREDFVDAPAWLNETKAWRFQPAGVGQWAVHMRVPIDPLATDVDGDNGLKLSTAGFKMWYEVKIKEITVRAGGSTTDVSAGGILRLNFPDGVALTGGGLVYPDPNVVGENYTFGAVAGIQAVSCPSVNGISLTYLDIGTDNVPSSYINPTASNTFFAKPTNNGIADVPTGAIKAVFRLANWGSSRTDATWTTIRSNEPNSNTIGAGTQAVGPPATTPNDIRFPMTGASVLALIPHALPTDPLYDPHQCMMVELSGAGLLFTTASAVRNMDFVLNSKDVRPATISIEGLKPIDSGPRDVYLAIETLNMPAKSQRDLGLFGPVFASDVQETVFRPGVEGHMLSSQVRSTDDDQDEHALYYKVQRAREMIRQRFNPEKQTKPEQRLTLMLDALRQVGATSEDLDQLFPTYRVHVYYDTGETWTVDGVTYPILGLQPSFGFYAYHEGPLLGFNHQLRGAIRIATNFYVLRVPNKGSARITTILHGISPGEEGQIEPEEPIQDPPKKEKPGCLARLLALIGIKL